MRKLKLGLEELRVDSFDTGAAGEGRGTVHGHVSQFCTRGPVTCDVGYTCDGGYTCAGDTCVVLSCDGACGSNLCATDPSCTTPSCLQTCPPQVTCQPGCV